MRKKKVAVWMKPLLAAVLCAATTIGSAGTVVIAEEGNGEPTATATTQPAETTQTTETTQPTDTERHRPIHRDQRRVMNRHRPVVTLRMMKSRTRYPIPAPQGQKAMAVILLRQILKTPHLPKRIVSRQMNQLLQQSQKIK